MDHENHYDSSLHATNGGIAEAMAPSNDLQALGTETAEVQLIESLLYPIGEIDFNQPFIVVSSEDHEHLFEDAKILTILKGSQYPVVISFWNDGIQMVAQFNADGEDEPGDYTVYNDIVGPRTMFIAVLLDGRVSSVDQSLHFTPELARLANKGQTIIDILPVTFDPATVAKRDLNEGGAEGDTGVEEEEEDDGDVAEHGGDEPEEGAPDQLYIAGHQRVVGANVRVNRRGFGIRTAKIVKMRSEPAFRQLFVDPQDGNEPYWARNASVQYGTA